MQKNQNQAGGNANDASQDRDKQQSQSGGNPDQQGGQKSQLTPSGGSNGSSKQQSQSGGGRDQQGSNLKSDHGQAQSRTAQPSQQGSDQGNRSDKPR